MDAAHAFADEQIEAFGKEIRREYELARIKAQSDLRAYLDSFEEADTEMKAAVEAGTLTEQAYKDWRNMQMLTGDRYAALVAQMADGIRNANEIALDVLSGKLPSVSAESANYAGWEVCNATGLSIDFALQDAGAIAVLLGSHDLYLPEPKLDVAKDLRWNSNKLSSAITQGVMLGESVPKIMRRVEDVVGSDYKHTMMVTRTCITAAENAGKMARYAEAERMGIKIVKQWRATLDMRTRHSHRLLDGENIGEDGRYSNGCRFPGDPAAPLSETANCRCRIVPVDVLFADEFNLDRWSKLPPDMTYEQWRQERAISKKREKKLLDEGKIEKRQGVIK